MNPLLQSNNAKDNRIGQLASVVRNLKNPTSNPQLQSILSLYNGDARTAFYTLCKQQGIDPETILSQLR